MNRREFMSIAGLAIVFPEGAYAQGKVPVVGLLVPNRLQDQPAYPIFVETLGSLGYREGDTLRLMVREAANDFDRLPSLARELVAAGVDAIVAFNTPGTQAAVNATREIPIVMTQVGDPVGGGFVASLARPGGNVTGVANLIIGLAVKRLALLKEAIPSARRVAVLYHAGDPITAQQVRDVEAAAGGLGVEVRMFPMRNPKELPAAVTRALAWKANAGLWLIGQQQVFQADTIKLAREHSLPVMVGNSVDVVSGGLMAYSPDAAEIASRTAAQLARILKGAKPGDLPVEQPTKFELVVNLKTAQALGIKIPQSILLQATKVIE